MSIPLNSVNNFIYLLQESDLQLQVLALQKLKQVVDFNWAEIADHLPKIESLYEDETFPQRELAAYLASKVYYHLEEYDDALHYALESKDYFNISCRDQYVDCLSSKCIDQYTTLQQYNYENREKIKQIDQKLIDIVEKMLDLCIKDGDFKQACGIALEVRRLDIVNAIIAQIRNNNLSDILLYLFELTKKVITSVNFKREVLNLLIENYKNKELLPQEYIILSQCYFLGEDSKSIANLLFTMINSNDEHLVLLAFQIAQDLSENENQSFVNNLISKFPVINLSDTDDKGRKIEQVIKPKLFKVLNGKLSEELNSLFLTNRNKTDNQVILNLKTGIDSKNSIVHESVIISNAIFQAGTTNQSFLVDNLEWISKASHWSKFTSVASLGVIHRGNHSKAMEILKPYFPNSTPTPNFYAHGGSFYALGLIHIGTRNPEVLNFLISAIKNPANNQNEVLIHGACLGIGLIGLASCDESLYEEIKNVLFTDSATTGEAAGLAIGLIMAGSRNATVINDILEYAHETKHEKIIRTIGLSLALIMFNAEENADTLIEELSNDKDSILRYGAMFMIGMAYVGKAKNSSISKLLHHASVDFCDDVRRAAVINLSFLLLNTPEKIPKILNLLSLSYNPHVRYGVAMAMGISSAGSANPESIVLLESMLNDAVSFVRQGAFIGLSMVLQQATEAMEPKVEKFRKTVKEIYSKKQEDVLSKMGAILANGILDAGGRNSIINLTSGSGFPKLASCAGIMIFTQFWYWFPFAHFLSLSLAPSAFFGVSSSLKIPKSFKFQCNSKQSLFDYPAFLKTEQKEVKKEAQKVDLSTTAKAKARAIKKAHDKEGMEIELNKGVSLTTEVSKVEDKKEEIEEEKKIEPNSFEIDIRLY